MNTMAMVLIQLCGLMLSSLNDGDDDDGDGHNDEVDMIYVST